MQPAAAHPNATRTNGTSHSQPRSKRNPTAYPAAMSTATLATQRTSSPPMSDTTGA